MHTCIVICKKEWQEIEKSSEKGKVVVKEIYGNRKTRKLKIQNR